MSQKYCLLDTDNNLLFVCNSWKSLNKKCSDIKVNISFPANELQQFPFIIKNYKLYKYQENIPSYNASTQKVSQNVGYILEDVYIRDYTVENLSQEEIDTNIQNQWNIIRNLRNDKLSDCDYTQCLDYNNALTEHKKQEWIDYREALRNVPQTQNDPFNIFWPVSPTE